jgi:hypothetical protein
MPFMAPATPGIFPEMARHRGEAGEVEQQIATRAGGERAQALIPNGMRLARRRVAPELGEPTPDIRPFLA